MAPKDADVLCSSVRAGANILPSMVWRWSGGRALRSPSGAFFAEVVPANDARLPPPLQAAISLQPMTAVGRVSRVRSGGVLQQISSPFATRTLRSAAVHRPRPHPAASRVLGCAGRAGFASPAHHLGAAAVVGWACCCWRWCGAPLDLGARKPNSAGSWTHATNRIPTCSARGD